MIGEEVGHVEVPIKLLFRRWQGSRAVIAASDHLLVRANGTTLQVAPHKGRYANYIYRGQRPLPLSTVSRAQDAMPFLEALSALLAHQHAMAPASPARPHAHTDRD
jgi:hypothetical protein